MAILSLLGCVSFKLNPVIPASLRIGVCAMGRLAGDAMPNSSILKRAWPGWLSYVTTWYLRCSVVKTLNGRQWLRCQRNRMQKREFWPITSSSPMPGVPCIPTNRAYCVAPINQPKTGLVGTTLRHWQHCAQRQRADQAAGFALHLM